MAEAQRIADMRRNLTPELRDKGVRAAEQAERQAKIMGRSQSVVSGMTLRSSAISNVWNEAADDARELKASIEAHA